MVQGCFIFYPSLNHAPLVFLVGTPFRAMFCFENGTAGARIFIFWKFFPRPVCDRAATTVGMGAVERRDRRAEYPPPPSQHTERGQALPIRLSSPLTKVETFGIALAGAAVAWLSFVDPIWYAYLEFAERECFSVAYIAVTVSAGLIGSHAPSTRLAEAFGIRFY